MNALARRREGNFVAVLVFLLSALDFGLDELRRMVIADNPNYDFGVADVGVAGAKL